MVWCVYLNGARDISHHFSRLGRRFFFFFKIQICVKWVTQFLCAHTSKSNGLSYALAKKEAMTMVHWPLLLLFFSSSPLLLVEFLQPTTATAECMAFITRLYNFVGSSWNKNSKVISVVPSVVSSFFFSLWFAHSPLRVREPQTARCYEAPMNERMNERTNERTNENPRE